MTGEQRGIVAVAYVVASAAALVIAAAVTARALAEVAWRRSGW